MATALRSSAVASRGRPKKLPDESSVLMVRCPDTLIVGLDDWVEELREKHVGMSGITRADLIRDILMRAVAERRATSAPKVPLKKRAR